MNKNITEKEIINGLLANMKYHIKTDSFIYNPKPFLSLVNAGFANYINGVVTRNWKTDYWTETLTQKYIPSKSIKTRFEILDL